MTPMPPEIPRTLAAHRMIIGKVQVVLAQKAIRIGALDALSLAFLPEKRIVVAQAKRQGMILTSQPYQTVERLHEAGFISCSGGEGMGRKLAVELTPSGVELAEDIRKALGGEEVVRMEAAE